jgi:hypothetical protein
MVGTHRQVFQVPELAVPGDPGTLVGKLIQSGREPAAAVEVEHPVGAARVQCLVAIGPGFQKEDRRQQIVLSEDIQDAAERRQFRPASHGAVIPAEHHLHLRVKRCWAIPPCRGGQRKEQTVGCRKREQRDRAPDF